MTDRIAEVELLIICRIVVNNKVHWSIIDVQQDVAIEQNVTLTMFSASLQHDANQRFTINRRSRTGVDSLTISIYALGNNNTRSRCGLVPTVNLGIYIQAFNPLWEWCITRVTSLIWTVLIVNKFELIVETPCLLFTKVQCLNIINFIVVNAWSSFTLLQILTQIVNSDVRLQVNTSSILRIKFKSRTVRIGNSLLRSIPYMDTRSQTVNSCTILLFVNSPTFFVTLTSARTTSKLINLRLCVDFLILNIILIPNQTFELNVSRNNQSIVRSNNLISIARHLQSNSVVWVVLIILITCLSIPTLYAIRFSVLISCERLIVTTLISRITISTIGIAVRVNSLICGPRSQLVGVSNLNTYIDDSVTILTEWLGVRNVSSGIPLTTSIVIAALLRVVIQLIEGRGRCNSQRRGCSTGVVVNDIGFQHIKHRITLITNSSTWRIQVVLKFPCGTINPLVGIPIRFTPVNTMFRISICTATNICLSLNYVTIRCCIIVKLTTQPVGTIVVTVLGLSKLIITRVEFNILTSLSTSILRSMVADIVPSLWQRYCTENSIT